MTTHELPLHPHPLKLRDFSEDYRGECDACFREICGLAYCCEQCIVLFHKSCAEKAQLEPQIHHPFHSQHPLVLASDAGGGKWIRCVACRTRCSVSYRCEPCGFSLDLNCAMSTLPKEEPYSAGEEEKGTLQYFGHEHPLTSFHTNEDTRIECRVCNRSMIAGSTSYGCCDCTFSVHKTCAEFPREIRHCTLHDDEHPLSLVVDRSYPPFNCPICKGDFKSIYQCQKCEFKIDPACALSITPHEDQREEKVDPDIHPHPLTPFSVKTEWQVYCHACESRKSGDIYACLDCRFFLHETCLRELPKETEHILHPGHYLSLNCLPKDYQNRSCAACGDGISHINFSCNSPFNCDFNLHVFCALRRPHIEEGESVKIKHFAHKHGLYLICRRTHEGCKACGNYSGNLVCGCPMRRCRFLLDKSCAQVSLTSSIKHAFHPQHRLSVLHEVPEFSVTCNACRQIGYDKGFALHCPDCDFYLDTVCASRKPALKHELHEHKLCYFPYAKGLECNFCGDSCNLDIYRCVQCDFNIHHDCTRRLPGTVTLPSFHRHSLTLAKFYVEDDYEWGEYICDICGKDRDINRGAYICGREECKLTVHIECAIPVANPLTKKVPAIVELDEKIENLNLRAKELKMELDTVLHQLESAKSERDNFYPRNKVLKYRDI